MPFLGSFTGSKAFGGGGGGGGGGGEGEGENGGRAGGWVGERRPPVILAHKNDHTNLLRSCQLHLHWCPPLTHPRLLSCAAGD